MALIGLGRLIGHARRALMRLLFGRPPARVVAYHGLGTTHRARLRCRVVDDDGVRDPRPDDSTWTNARRMFRVFDARRVAGARLELRCAGVRASVCGDGRGFAEVELIQPLPAFPAGGGEVEWALLEPAPDGAPGVARAPVHIPRLDARFAVVSDVDDTVIESRAASALKLAYETLGRNVYRRVPMPGMAPLYRALTGGREPLVWLTSSIWRVHDLLRAFFELHRFPPAPLLMSDARLLRSQWIADRHETHKLEHLRALAGLWSLPLVLSGDCGQRDPEIFAAFAAEHPVRAIYLRDLGDAARQRDVEALLAPLRARGIPICVADEARVFTRHAAEHGLLHRAAAPAGQDRSGA